MPRSFSPQVRSLFSGIAVAGIALGTIGCQSTAQSDVNNPAVGDTGEYDITVQGADATREGDTIKLEYPQPTDFIDRVPEWVINPTIGGVTGSIGVAAQNDLGRKEQLDEARLNARVELAAMLETRVQRVGRGELEQDTRVESGGDASRSRKNTIAIDRAILDAVLAGSRQRALWVDNDTGECYVWMVLDGAVLARADRFLAEDVAIFRANQAIATEYRPDRRRFEKPTVIVTPRIAVPLPVVEPEVAPVVPTTPIEELEERLKPIETITLNGEG